MGKSFDFSCEMVQAGVTRRSEDEFSELMRTVTSAVVWSAMMVCGCAGNERMVLPCCGFSTSGCY